MKTVEHVGIRELRQNLSVYIRRVEAGEVFDVQSRGKTVAQLSPVKEEKMSKWERMVAAGDIVEAAGSLKDLPDPTQAPPSGKTTAEILDELREERL